MKTEYGEYQVELKSGINMKMRVERNRHPKWMAVKGGLSFA
jgi:hypothetical protein